MKNEPTPEDPGDRTKLSLGAIASLSGGALLVVFMLQNREDVSLDFLVWGFILPLWLVILVSASVGAAVWFALSVMRRHNRRKARRESRRD